MIVWGGTHGQPRSDFVNDGGSYNPATDTWTTLPPSPLRPRIGAEAVWTGHEMIIWGGFGGTNAQAQFFGDGARYNPATKSWSLLPTTGAPSPRWGHSMVWTGHDLLIWGGEGGTGTPLNDGARFDPTTNRWSPLPTVGAPTGRTYQATAWTGKEMIVWGGQGPGVFYRDGARFNPTTGVWTSLPSAGTPSAREYATGFWNGSQFVVWGGNDTRSRPTWDGARYNPVTNAWSSLPPAPLTPRLEASATWTGRDLIVWGGVEDDESGVTPLITPHDDGISLHLF
jgi:N-acetylneuraminic acid mutarotase